MSDAASRLVAKLTDLDLEDDESALLATVFRRAAGAGGPATRAIDLHVINVSHDEPLAFAKPCGPEFDAFVGWLQALETLEPGNSGPPAPHVH